MKLDTALLYFSISILIARIVYLQSIFFLLHLTLKIEIFNNIKTISDQMKWMIFQRYSNKKKIQTQPCGNKWFNILPQTSKLIFNVRIDRERERERNGNLAIECLDSSVLFLLSHQVALKIKIHQIRGNIWDRSICCCLTRR